MNQVQVFPQWLTLALAVWSAVGPLLGVICGAWLARSSERAKWINENKKLEFRELLDAFARAQELSTTDGMGGEIPQTAALGSCSTPSSSSPPTALSSRPTTSSSSLDSSVSGRWISWLGLRLSLVQPCPSALPN